MGAVNKANGVRGVGSVSDIRDAVSVEAGDTTNGGSAASFVPEINASRALQLGFPFLISAHVNAPMISLNRALLNTGMNSRFPNCY